MEAKLTTIICSIGEILRRFEYGISLANDMEHDLISVERNGHLIIQKTINQTSK